MVLLHAIFLIDGIKECEAIFVRLKQYIFFFSTCTFAWAMALASGFLLLSITLPS
jgi:hypothetical protein